jgi:hypothetical protein
VKGIRYLARRMRRWQQRLGDKKAAQYLGQVVRMLEEIGTGGAGFRFIYAAFLQEAAEITGNRELLKASVLMTENGDRWREFAVISGRIIKDRAGSLESYGSAADILMDIADREEKIFLFLRNLKLS